MRYEKATCQEGEDSLGSPTLLSVTPHPYSVRKPNTLLTGLRGKLCWNGTLVCGWDFIRSG